MNDKDKKILEVARNAIKSVDKEFANAHHQQPKHYHAKFQRGWITLHVTSTHEFSNRIPKFSGEHILFINGADSNGELHHLKCYSSSYYCDMNNVSNLVGYLHRILKKHRTLHFRYFRTHGTSVVTKAVPVLDNSVVQ